ncbi:MAG TPA: phage holin family protein [Allosphingosinicella sp.]|nr:phage holin family protein [Allosphingosinicella sp.]
MHGPVDTPQEDSIADLVGRLVDEGREVARAEVNLYKQIALRRSARAKSGLVLLVAAGLLAWFAGLALTFGLVLALATLIGPLAAGLALALVMGVAAWFLLQKGLAGMKALSGDEEERAALQRGEALP